jgi:hypothetical protein
MLFCISLISLDTELLLVPNTGSVHVYLDRYFKQTGTQHRQGYVLPYIESFDEIFYNNTITGGNFVFLDIQTELRLVSSSSKDFTWYGNANTVTNDADLAQSLKLPRLSAKISRIKCSQNKIELIRDNLKQSILHDTEYTTEFLTQLVKQNIIDIHKQTHCRASVFSAGRDTGTVNVLGRGIIERLYIPKLVYEKLSASQKDQLKLNYNLIVANEETFEQLGLVNPQVPDKHGINYHRHMFPIPAEDYVFTGLYGETTLIPNLRYIELLCNKLNYFPPLIDYLKTYVWYDKPSSPLDPMCTGTGKKNIITDLTELWYNVRFASSYKNKLWVDPYRDFRILRSHFNKSAKEIIDTYNSMEPYKSIIESVDSEYFKNLITATKNDYSTL